MSQPHQPVVLIPSEVIALRAHGLLYGYAHLDELTFNVITCGAPPERPEAFAACAVIGELCVSDSADHPKELLGRYTEAGLEFTYKGKSCRLEPYSLVLDVFSRNSGIVETSSMLASRAVISGCGSVGSLVALELARAGIGNFLLIDNDRLAYHNICRHQCGITDVGRFKTAALKDRILDVNSNAKVCSLRETIESAPKTVFDEWCKPPCVIVGCADNREADLYANKMSCLYEIPFVSIGFWERAFAGEVFWSVPGEMACYNCVFGTRKNNVLSYRTSKNRRIYTNQSNLPQVTFEPGISLDISFGTIIGAKIALDLLLRKDNSNAGTRTISSLTQFTLLCNTTDPKIGGELASIFSFPLQITRSIEVEKLVGCAHCALVPSAGATS
jgi:molybdopterin/thiamine biosynthesis adenylyltransferase